MAKKLKDDETAQNEMNIKLKGQAWYNDYLRSIGQNPSKVKLSGDQRKQLTNLAAQNGMPLPEGVVFDPSGNVNEKHGFAGQPTWLKAAEIAGVAAPAAIFGAPALASALGIGGGLTPVASMAVPELGLDAIPSVVGGASALGTAGKIAKAAGTGLSTFDKIGELLGAGAGAVGAATSAAGNNRYENEDRAYRAAALNMQGEREQQNLEDAARRNLYRGSVAKAPMTSQFNTRGVQQLSPEMMQGLSSLEQAGLKRLSMAPDNVKAYQPYTPNLKKSTMETIGDYAAPGMSTLATIAKMF